MKGISTVIATILMLLITVGMAGMAYMYISGMFTSEVAQRISLSSADCTGGEISVMVKNSGTESITITDIRLHIDSDADVPCKSSGTLSAGSSTLCESIDKAAGTHTVKIVGPANAVTGSVYCAS